MEQFFVTQREFTLRPRARGFHLITDEIIRNLPRLPQAGLLHLFIKHTSAGLSINENADPDVQTDMEAIFNHLVKEREPYYMHTCEGDDDMPAHAKSTLTGNSLSIPITDGRLNMGIWQGIYLCEFRNHGEEVAKLLIQQGWHIGIAGRREEALEKLQATAPGQIEIQRLDVTDPDAPTLLETLIRKLGGMDLFFLSSGIGSQNPDLKPEIELNTARTNVEGFTRMVTAAFNHFKNEGGGHIAVISSIAGTKGLGIAPAYSATKRFQNTYIEALAQLSRMQHLNIHFTDIRPGFVATDLLKSGKFPMLMQANQVAKSIVHALNRKKRVIVIDGRYRVVVFFWRMIPRWLWERLPIKN